MLQCCVRLSSSSVCTECIVAKRCVLEQKLLDSLFIHFNSDSKAHKQQTEAMKYKKAVLPQGNRAMCSFRLKFANNIHYKYKTIQASKAAMLQSSKHASAKHNLTHNPDSKSIKVTCLESVEKQ